MRNCCIKGTHTISLKVDTELFCLIKHYGIDHNIKSAIKATDMIVREYFENKNKAAKEA